MATFTYGTLVDPAHFVEVQDEDYVDPDPPTVGGVPAPRTLMVRPAAGATLLVRNPATLALLTPITTLAFGYWLYTTDIPQIQISGNGGSSWVGPLTAVEAVTSAITAGVDATSALQASAGAVATANNAASAVSELAAIVAAGGGGGGFTGSVDWNTQIINRPAIPSQAGDVGAIALSARGAAGGVASLGDGTGGTVSGKVPIGQLPVGATAADVAAGNHSHARDWTTMPAGSVGFIVYDSVTSQWPARPTTRTDVLFIWVAFVGTPPPPTGGGYAIDGVDRFEILPAP